MQDHDISYWNSIQILIRDGLQIRPHEKDKYIFIDRKLHSSALGKPKRPLACVPWCPSIPQFWHLPFPWLLRSIPSLWTCGPLVPLAAANAAEPGTFTQPFVQCLLPVACRPARSSTLFWCYEALKFIHASCRQNSQHCCIGQPPDQPKQDRGCKLHWHFHFQ